jgi:hypothetical protein
MEEKKVGKIQSKLETQDADVVPANLPAAESRKISAKIHAPVQRLIHFGIQEPIQSGVLNWQLKTWSRETSYSLLTLMRDKKR